MSKRVNIVLPPDLLTRVDQLRGASPVGARPSFSATVVALLRRGLDATNDNGKPPPSAA